MTLKDWQEWSEKMNSLHKANKEIKILFDDAKAELAKTEESIARCQQTVNEIKKMDAAEVVSKRPEREEVINHDDEVNLKIALNSCTSLEDFLRLI